MNRRGVNPYLDMPPAIRVEIPVLELPVDMVAGGGIPMGPDPAGPPSSGPPKKMSKLGNYDNLYDNDEGH